MGHPSILADVWVESRFLRWRYGMEMQKRAYGAGKPRALKQDKSNYHCHYLSVLDFG